MGEEKGIQPIKILATYWTKSYWDKWFSF